MSSVYQAYINGIWVAAASGATTANTDPANTANIIGHFPAMDERDARTALEAASVAFPDWQRSTPIARGEILFQTARLLRERMDDIAYDLTREEGKPLAEARAEVTKAADTLTYYGAFGRRALGEVLPDARTNVLTLTMREPLGVVVAITPWNVPLAIPARKIAPALITGNTIVLKPASLTPLTALHLVQAFADAGLPPGVLNLVMGSGNMLGRTLTSHPAVRAISFTGSTEIGQTIIREAAPHGVRVQTEMGGKNVLVVLADADLELATTLTVSSAYALSGQQCTATSRVLVEQSIYSAYLEQLIPKVQAIHVGPGLDPATQMGPLLNGAQLAYVLASIEQAKHDHVRVLAGGERLTGGVYDHGFFMAPTILADAHTDMACMQEEIFGPVVSVGAISSLAEAITAANGTRYGLSAAICTNNLHSAQRFVREVDAGTIGINVPTTGWDVQVPFGGFKDSGSPFKEHAADAVAFFSRIKSIAMNSLPSS